MILPKSMRLLEKISNKINNRDSMAFKHNLKTGEAFENVDMDSPTLPKLKKIIVKHRFRLREMATRLGEANKLGVPVNQVILEEPASQTVTSKQSSSISSLKYSDRKFRVMSSQQLQ